MNISFSPPDISELEINEVVDAMKSGWITTGPRTKLFENMIAKYCGTPKAVALNSCTSALELVLRYYGVGPGDEVIVPAYTYTATASVVHHVGATIVMCDVKKGTFHIDYKEIEKKITPRTKVVIPVDIGGVMVNYAKIFKIVESKKDLFMPANEAQEKIGRVLVLSDAAHSFGAVRDGKRAGAYADFTAFSFHAVKNLTTAEGGAITWRSRKGIDDEKLYHWFMLYSHHGQSKEAFSKMQLGAWEYDIVYPAYKCNMTDIAAAMGIMQLKRFDGLMEKRKAVIREYDKKLLPLGIERLQHFSDDGEGNGHLYLMRVPGITEKQRNEITLPLHTLLTNEEIGYIAETMRNILEGTYMKKAPEELILKRVRENDEEALTKEVYLVTDEKNSVIATFNMSESPSMYFDTDKKAMYFQRLGVIPSLWRRGVGSRLFEMIEERARKDGRECIRCTMYSESRNAVYFLKKHGFKTLYKRPSKHFILFCMEKEL